MEVLAGPTFSIQVDDNNNTNHDNSIFLKDDDPISGNTHLIGSPIHPSNGFYSDSSSSLGAPDNSDDDDEEEEEEEEEVGSGSSSKGPLLGLVDSLEDSLPIKRGLSTHFAGKSKSFTNLSDVRSESATVKDLVKPDNPFNKRRRMLLASRLAFRSSSSSSSFYTCSIPKSMPLLALPEHQEQEQQQDDDDDDGGEGNQSSSSSENQRQFPRLQRSRFKQSCFKSHSCFSFCHLHQQ